MEDFFLSEVFPASSITDAAIILDFFELNDALAIARGNRLEIHKIESNIPQDQQVYELYGEIMRLIPIHFSGPSPGNLLVILKDYQVCILMSDEEDSTNIKTLSYGNIAPTCNEHLPPLKYALHPNALVLQVLHSRLDVYPITSNSSLDASFLIEIGCKRIIDFQFIGPTSKVTRLAVLTEEFNKAPHLRLYEIDVANRTVKEDLEKAVTLPIDTYKLIPYDPENKSIIVAFSSQQAIRIFYSGLNPDKKTATILTMRPLTHLLSLKPDFYVAIDELQNLRCFKLEEEGSVSFIDVAKCPKPSCVVSISNSLAFIGSERDDSIIYSIEEGPTSPTGTVFETIRSTGACLKFFRFENSFLSIFERALVASKLMAEFRVLMKISCLNFAKVFQFDFNDDISCYLLSSFQSTKILGSSLDGTFFEFKNDRFCYDYPTIYFAEISRDEKTFIQITQKKILLFTVDKVLATIDVDEKEVISASMSGLTFAYATEESLHIFEINFEDEQIFIEKKLPAFSKPEGQILAVSISDSFVAFSTSSPNKVVIVPLAGEYKLMSYDVDGSIVDLVFAFDLLLALDVMDKVNVIDFTNDEKSEIFNDLGNFNTSFTVLNENEVIVNGKSPFIINKNLELVSIRLSNSDNNCFICSNFLNGNLVLLDSEGLMVGNLQDPSFFNKCYASETPIIDIFKVGPAFVTARKVYPNPNDKSKYFTSLFASMDKLDFYQNAVFITNHQGQVNSQNLEVGEPFFTLTDEKYRGYYIEKDNLFISTAQRIIRFKIEVCEHMYDDSNMHNGTRIIVTLCGDKTHVALDMVNKQQQIQKQQKPQLGNLVTSPLQINGFGTFRDYAYVQYEKQINFYAADISNPFGCELFPIFTLKNIFKDRIELFTISNSLAAIYTVSKYVIPYTFDEFMERFIPLPPYQSFTEITAISIVGRKILCASKSGNLFTLKHVYANNSMQADLVADEAVSVGQTVTALKTFPDIHTTLVGTEKGMLMALRKMDTKSNHLRLTEVYQQLILKMTSIGNFPKKFQRAPKEDRFMLPGRFIFDMDVIKRFLDLPKNEKEKILGSKFSVEDAVNSLRFEAIH